MFGAYVFGQPYPGQSPSIILVVVDTAAPDFRVLIRADDLVFMCPSDDFRVLVPADTLAVEVSADDLRVRVPADDMTGVI